MSQAEPESTEPLRSVHTNTFPELLTQLGASVWVTTYQAGKLVILRNDAGVLKRIALLARFDGISRTTGKRWLSYR